MGLTVHFKLAAPADCSEEQAKKIVAAMRRVALRSKRKGLVDSVSGIGHDHAARKLAVEFTKYRHPDYGEQWTDVWPRQAEMFEVEVGEDCEPLRLGLGQYPSRVRHLGGERPTRLGKGWRLASFSKTQFASLHGWEHFQRCHCAVVEMLVAFRSLGLRVRISDEGEYWPRRSVTALRRNLDEMNGVVAGAAGALKDLDEAIHGRSNVESPIFAHRQFEQLAAEGEAKRGAAIRRAEQEVSRLLT